METMDTAPSWLPDTWWVWHPEEGPLQRAEPSDSHPVQQLSQASREERSHCPQMPLQPQICVWVEKAMQQLLLPEVTSEWPSAELYIVRSPAAAVSFLTPPFQAMLSCGPFLPSCPSCVPTGPSQPASPSKLCQGLLTHSSRTPPRLTGDLLTKKQLLGREGRAHDETLREEDCFPGTILLLNCPCPVASPAI